MSMINWELLAPYGITPNTLKHNQLVISSDITPEFKEQVMLPEGLVVDNLCIKNCGTVIFLKDIVVNQSLVINNCKDVKALGILTCDSFFLARCIYVRSLDNLSVRTLNLTDCAGIGEVTNSEIKESAILTDCGNLTELPNGTVLKTLEVDNCNRLGLDNDITVTDKLVFKGNIYLNHIQRKLDTLCVDHTYKIRIKGLVEDRIVTRGKIVVKRVKEKV